MAEEMGGNVFSCQVLHIKSHIHHTSNIFDCLNIIFLSFRTDRFCQIVQNVLLFAILSASF